MFFFSVYNHFSSGEGPGPEVINFVHAYLNYALHFPMLIKSILLMNANIFCFQPLRRGSWRDNNVKMPTIIDISTLMSMTNAMHV